MLVEKTLYKIVIVKKILDSSGPSFFLQMTVWTFYQTVKF